MALPPTCRHDGAEHERGRYEDQHRDREGASYLTHIGLLSVPAPVADSAVGQPDSNRLHSPPPTRYPGSLARRPIGEPRA